MLTFLSDRIRVIISFYKANVFAVARYIDDVAVLSVGEACDIQWQQELTFSKYFFWWKYLKISSFFWSVVGDIEKNNSKMEWIIIDEINES